jgi:hypothetical protein
MVEAFPNPARQHDSAAARAPWNLPAPSGSDGEQRSIPEQFGNGHAAAVGLLSELSKVLGCQTNADELGELPN